MRAQRNARQLEFSLVLIWAITFASLWVAESARDEVIRLTSLLGIGEWTVWVLQVLAALLAASALHGIRSSGVVAVHAALIAGVSGLAALADSSLLVHPLGPFVLNVFLTLVTYLAYRLRSSGWSAHLARMMVGAVALIWLFQGLVPKVLFQDPLDLDLLETFTAGRGEPTQLLLGLGVLEILLGLLTLVLRRLWLRRLLIAEAGLLVVLGGFSGILDPALWWDPFVPVPKTLLVGATALILARWQGAEDEFQGTKLLNSG